MVTLLLKVTEAESLIGIPSWQISSRMVSHKSTMGHRSICSSIVQNILKLSINSEKNLGIHPDILFAQKIHGKKDIFLWHSEEIGQQKE